MGWQLTWARLCPASKCQSKALPADISWASSLTHSPLPARHRFWWWGKQFPWPSPGFLPALPSISVPRAGSSPAQAYLSTRLRPDLEPVGVCQGHEAAHTTQSPRNDSSDTRVVRARKPGASWGGLSLLPVSCLWEGDLASIPGWPQKAGSPLPETVALSPLVSLRRLGEGAPGGTQREHPGLFLPACVPHKLNSFSFPLFPRPFSLHLPLVFLCLLLFSFSLSHPHFFYLKNYIPLSLFLYLSVSFFPTFSLLLPPHLLSSPISLSRCLSLLLSISLSANFNLFLPIPPFLFLFFPGKFGVFS